MQYYMGIDIGTTGCKASLIDEYGMLRANYYSEYPLIIKGSHIEQDSNDWWRLTSEAIISLVRESTICDIAAVSVSTQGISFVPVDKNGNTLSNAISWLDTRAKGEADMLRGAFGEKIIYQKTGKNINSMYTLPKLMWMIKNSPKLYNEADKLLMPLDYINFKLTGQAVTDYSMASGTMLFNNDKMCWDQDLVKYSQIDTDKLPKVMCMGDEIGQILPNVADSLGISRKAKVIMGGQDQKLAALGAGISDDVCTVSIGTATAITAFGKIGTESGLKYSIFAFDNNRRVSEACIPTTGSALKWAAGVLFSGKTYIELDMLAEQSENGSGGVVFTPDFSSNAKIEGLTLATTKGEIIYALYEGVSRQIKGYTDMLASKDSKLYVFGGGSKSEIWCRVLSDITGHDVCILDSAETAIIGAAFLASGRTLPCASIKKTIYAKQNKYSEG